MTLQDIEKIVKKEPFPIFCVTHQINPETKELEFGRINNFNGFLDSENRMLKVAVLGSPVHIHHYFDDSSSFDDKIRGNKPKEANSYYELDTRSIDSERYEGYSCGKSVIVQYCEVIRKGQVLQDFEKIKRPTCQFQLEKRDTLNL